MRKIYCLTLCLGISTAISSCGIKPSKKQYRTSSLAGKSNGDRNKTQSDNSKSAAACENVEAYLTYEKIAAPLAEQYCVSCHNQQNASGGYRLDRWSDDKSENHKIWSAALRRMGDSDSPMPPKGMPSPSSEEISFMQAWYDAGIPDDALVGECGEKNNLKLSCQGEEIDTSLHEMRRLSSIEYVNTLRDLFGREIVEHPTVAFELSLLPEDQITAGGFSNLELETLYSHIEVYSNVSYAIAETIASSIQNRQDLFKCGSQVSRACAAIFLKGFATKIFRAPLNAEEVVHHLALYDAGSTANEGVLMLLAGLLQHPRYFYRTEVNGTLTGDHLALTDYEIATRMSYAALGTTPDDQLLAAAKAGKLSSAEGRKIEAERLFGGEKAKQHVRSFYSQWLKLDEIPDENYTEAFTGNVNPQGIGEAAAEEVLQFVDHLTWKTEGSYEDLMTSRTSVVTSSELAKVYGVNAQQAPIDLTAERPGLMSRLGFIIGGSDETSPIHRGFLVRTQLLCETITLPDGLDLPEGALEEPEPSVNETTRQRWHEKTSSSPICASCHNRINPIGFVLEEFDALGRYRLEEVLRDDNGRVVNRLPIDNKADIQIGSQTRTVRSTQELAEFVVESGAGGACFAEQWFRFGLGRDVESADACYVSKISTAVNSGDLSLKEAMMELMLLPEFSLRRIKGGK